MADFPNLSRRGFLNRSAAVGGLLVVPGLLSACSKTDAGSADGAGALDKLRKQGFVRVAYANEAPYGYLEGKQLKGEAPTLHREIFKALGVDELKPTLSEWDGLIPGCRPGSMTWSAPTWPSRRSAARTPSSPSPSSSRPPR